MSDVRLTTDVVGITSALSKVNQIRGVEHKWSSVATDNCGIASSTDKKFAVISDEIESIIPEVILSNRYLGSDGTKYKDISYSALVPILIEAIKDLKKENDDLKTLIKNSSSFASLKSSL